MKPANETVRGRIVGYDQYRGELLIRARYDDLNTMLKRQYKDCNIQLVDSRPLSDKQRKACYALLNEISDYTGIGLEPTKIVMKHKFMSEELGEPDGDFSLSTASMSLTCAFQRYLIRFVLDFDVPCRFPLMRFVDDTQDYLYHCVVTRKCCICGKRADTHHVHALGSGRNRSIVVHEGMEVLPLCRLHHNEIHQIGKISFFNKYHLDTGVILDKALCKLLNLRAKNEEEADELNGDQTHQIRPRTEEP